MPLQIEITSEHKDLVGDDYVRRFGPEGGTIGRSLENDWILPDPDRFISGRHATIDFRAGAYYLADTSTNGVFVNDEEEPIGRGNPRRLFDGDRLRMGDFEFLVRIDEGEEIEVPPPSPMSVVPDHPELRLQEEKIRSGIQLIDEEELTGEAAFQRTVFGRTTRRMSPAKVNGAARPAAARPAAPPRKPARRPAPPRPRRDPGTLTAEQLFEDFLAGLGIRRSELHPDVDASEALHTAGQVLREFVTGMVELLIARANLKSMFQLDQTTVLPRHNNPLKLSENTDELIKQLLVGKAGEYLGPLDSVREVSRDLKFHHDAVVQAMTDALEEFGLRFHPGELAEGFDATGRKPLLGAFGKLKYWQQYCELYPMLVEPAVGPFPNIFAEAFVRAYEKSIADAKRLDRDDSEAA
ncbi:MAG TPA: type VI secretion system-associated FHA domain protein TagH [Woeseiaceae bacterium]|nr:type VI secretion system-associated FHA domain protein TagH [Woeseiaceae bacterium]